LNLVVEDVAMFWIAAAAVYGYVIVLSLWAMQVQRHLRHTGLTWMADAGVPIHVLRKIAGHGSLTGAVKGGHVGRSVGVVMTPNLP
jgi:hypothetical protein